MSNHIGKRINSDGKKKRKKKNKKKSIDSSQYGVLAMRKSLNGSRNIMCLFVFANESDADEYAAHELGELSYMQRIIGKGKPSIRTCFVDIPYDSISFEHGRYIYRNDGTNETVYVVRDASGIGVLTNMIN